MSIERVARASAMGRKRVAWVAQRDDSGLTRMLRHERSDHARDRTLRGRRQSTHRWSIGQLGQPRATGAEREQRYPAPGDRSAGESPSVRSLRAAIRCAHVEASGDVRCRLWPHDCTAAEVTRRTAGPAPRPYVSIAASYRATDLAHRIVGRQPETVHKTLGQAGDCRRGIAHRAGVVSATQTLLTT
jgi:hypothetical protein